MSLPRIGWPVGEDTAPPEPVAYAEDARDRLWTRSAGLWRCLTDITGVTSSGPWDEVWRAHGPLTPLVPAGPAAVEAVAEVLARFFARNRVPRAVPDPVDAGTRQWAREALLAAAEAPPHLAGQAKP